MAIRAASLFTCMRLRKLCRRYAKPRSGAPVCVLFSRQPNFPSLFVFGVIYQVITACGHKVGWLIAKKSWDRKVPGFFARAMSCIPVVRPQVTNVPVLSGTRCFGQIYCKRCASALRIVLSKQSALCLDLLHQFMWINARSLPPLFAIGRESVRSSVRSCVVSH